MARVDYLETLEQAWQQHLAPREFGAPTVVSTFAGCGGSSLGYSMAGFRELLAVEWNDNAVETFKLNFPGVPVYHGDIHKLSVEQVLEMTGLQPGELDLLDGSPPCFPAGFEVLTLCGKIPIEFCTTGVQVLTHLGQFKRVKRTMKKNYTGSIYTISTKYGRKPIDCTPEHPFFVRKRITLTRDCKGRKNGSRYKSYLEPEWIEAQDLSVGDVILEPHQQESVDLDIPKIIKKQRINIAGVSGSEEFENRLLESECSIDWQTKEMAWLLGFYLAEGHTRGRNPTLDINGPCRRETIYSVANKEALMLAEKLQQVGFHSLIQRHSKGASRVTVTSIDFWALCQVVGKYADGKFIPSAFMCQSIEWQKAMLDGYFAGDGCIVKSKRINSSSQKATTVSWKLAIGIAKMIACVHRVVASIGILYPAGIGEIEGRTVTVKEAYSVGYTLPTSSKIRPGFVDDFGAWLPIKSIDTKNASIAVYNLEVEEDNSYTVEDIAVHNCQGFSTAGKRKMEDKRNQLYMQFVRLLRGLKPKVFVMENVSGLVKGKMKLIFADIMTELKASGYQVRCKLLNAMYFNVPQSRQRLIWIGVRDDLGVGSSFPGAESKPITIRDAVNNCSHTPPPDLQDNRFTRLYDQVPVGGTLEDVLGKGRNFNNMLKMNPNKPAQSIPKTVTNRGAFSIVHWVKKRLLSIEEIKRLHSFPDEMQFVGQFEMQWERIGNSVPPLMMKSIASHIRTEILLV